MTGPLSFRFLNREAEIGGSQGWNDPGFEKLWLYNLHYFDDLNAAGARERKAWHAASISHWIRENPPGEGNGWESYPLSLRIVNWIKWLFANPASQEPLLLASLAHQTRFLRSRLEYRLLANHLFANAKALVFSGVVFEGVEAQKWLDAGLALLASELPEQVLPDGGHFERSPMYHSIILEDLLDLLNLGRAYPEVLPQGTLANWKAAAERMLQWLDAMTHPDAEIAFFNDAAFGIACSPSVIGEYAARLGCKRSTPVFDPAPAVDLTGTGFARLSTGQSVVIFDAGEIGPAYQPGHAHAGLLSFELSHHGRRVLVNSGASTYQDGPLRHYERGTSAHNTLRVDGVNQSETWGAFRVARRARVVNRNVGPSSVEAGHDGYVRLPDPVIHSRHIELTRDELIISDTLEARGEHTAEIFFHVHPEVHGEREGSAFSLGRAIRLEPDGKLQCHIEESTWRPQFGLSLRNQLIKGKWRGRCPVSFITRIRFS